LEVRAPYRIIANGNSDFWTMGAELDFGARHSTQSGQSILSFSRFKVPREMGNVLGALKLLQENQTRERRARLVREVSDLEKLVGIPGIPRVLEHNASSFERTGDSPYIVLELISGETLNERFQRELDIETSVRLILKLCEIVGSCHARGVCHRDIKPNNIMIGPDISRVWLIDFGMSWSEEAAEHFDRKPVSSPARILRCASRRKAR
jgi:serine/threonine protein kinase